MKDPRWTTAEFLQFTRTAIEFRGIGSESRATLSTRGFVGLVGGCEPRLLVVGAGEGGQCRRVEPSNDDHQGGGRGWEGIL